ncbi:retrovirus-related pol polyprotein from transposon tnt 1-94 [Lasius niger]|uniref:Retrovirus-related pol polyprotein from transposon tnt 1-94 n=1 Tax=Lasius niger TaxID=67767 RepID=A0A0J7K943_LASNI|nr:retrovirus-related pol polyprotein from transposon tnt 1-94 [Lasius niger]
MHVPNLFVNLLSVSEIVKKGYVFLFNADGCKIYDEDDFVAQREVKMTGTEINGIYRLDAVDARSNTSKFNDPTNAHANVTKMTSNLWHRRLGHVNYTDVNRLKDDLATGINFANSDAVELPCKTCLEGKQSRQPFKVNKDKLVAEHKLDLLHTDLCGPMPIESWSGKRYM